MHSLNGKGASWHELSAHGSERYRQVFAQERKIVDGQVKLSSKLVEAIKWQDTVVALWIKRFCVGNQSFTTIATHCPARQFGLQFAAQPTFSATKVKDRARFPGQVGTEHPVWCQPVLDIVELHQVGIMVQPVLRPGVIV